jgi:peptidoglycan biosynthesis protein MviN/MurJ (putative lipid II flippase)
MVWAASIWGLVGAAWATSATAALQLLLNYAIIWRAAGISPAAVGTAIWRSVAACLAMSGVVLPLLQWWPRTDATFSLFLELCCALVVGTVVYVVVHLVLWRVCGMPASAEKHALQAVSSLVTRLTSRRTTDRG